MRSTSTSPLTSRIKFRSLLAVCLPLLLIGAAYAQAPVWNKTTPADVAASGIGVQLTGCDYGNNVFVLAGYFGVAATPFVYTSPDGATWTRRALPVADGSTGAPRFLNGKFLLGVTPSTGGNGVILSSADGVTWTSSASLGGTINAPNEFAFGGGLYFAPIDSTSAQVLTSPDGITWTGRALATGTASQHVTFFKNKFYASAYNRTATTGAGLYSSADGIAWSRIAGAPTSPGILAASSSTLLVTFSNGNTPAQSVSADGVTFTTASPGINISVNTEIIKYLNGAFVATDVAVQGSNDLTLARGSSDGLTWNTIGSTANHFGAPEVAYGGGHYVFVGEFDIFSDATAQGGGGGSAAPTISTQPASQTVAIGGGVTFTVTVTGTGLSYQWYFNGIAISGEINVNLILSAITAAQAGNYTVKITNANGTVTSSTATLTVATLSNAGRIVNMSVRTGAGSGSQSLIVGFVLGGAGTTGNTSLLVRAVGPSLGAFGVPNFIADPSLTAYANGVVVATNDNWSGDAAISAAATRVGAFSLASAQSKDAALFANPQSGVYSAVVSGPTSGIALAEIYDASTTYTASTPRLLNVSARAQVGTGNDVLIAGFVIGGSTSRTVLVRAIGPTLAGFGVTGSLADPKVTLFAGSTKLAENDNWSDATNAAAIATASATVGAFTLAPGTKDAALLITLPPGVYSAQVSGVSSTTGVGLVEIYEAP